MKKNKIKIVKMIITILVIAIFIYSIYYLFPIMKNIVTPKGRLVFREKIVQEGAKGFFVLFGLECAQIFLVILPGEPLEILAKLVLLAPLPKPIEQILTSFLLAVSIILLT